MFSFFLSTSDVTEINSLGKDEKDGKLYFWPNFAFLKKEFILNIILLLSINFLIKPFYLFGVDLHIQNIVGTDTYGMYKVLFNIAFLLQFVHEPGIQAFNSQNIAKTPDKLGFHLPRILGLKIILGIIYFILAIRQIRFYFFE